MRQNKSRILFIGLLMLLGSVMAVMAQDATEEATPDAAMEAGPDVIPLAQQGLMPEGVAYNPAIEQFLVSSLSQGTISAVDLDGTITPFAQSENLTSSVGLEVDEAQNRVLAAVNNQGQGSAALGIYDINDGSELGFVDLGTLVPDAEGYFVNDVAADGAGNAYVTDSAAGVIYKVDSENTASVWLDDESFHGQFVINGIAYHPDGYLIAVRQPGLIKIPVDSPTDFTTVESEQDISGGDGIIFLNDTTLVVVSGRQGKVLRLESDDDFATARVTGTFDTMTDLQATTAAVRGDEVYIVYTSFQDPTVAEYRLQRVTFTDAMEQSNTDATAEATAAS
jgi:DNA-binding beta-propeller fold protein YncE